MVSYKQVLTVPQWYDANFLCVLKAFLVLREILYFWNGGTNVLIGQDYFEFENWRSQICLFEPFRSKI